MTIFKPAICISSRTHDQCWKLFMKANCNETIWKCVLIFFKCLGNFLLSFSFYFFFLNFFLIWLLWIYYKFSFSDTWTSKVANISMKLSYIFIKIKQWSVVYSYFMLITVNGHAWQIYGRNQTDSFSLLKKRIIYLCCEQTCFYCTMQQTFDDMFKHTEAYMVCIFFLFQLARITHYTYIYNRGIFTMKYKIKIYVWNVKIKFAGRDNHTHMAFIHTYAYKRYILWI